MSVEQEKQSIATGRQALIEVIKARMPITISKGEADGTRDYLVIATNRVMTAGYAEPATSLDALPLSVLAELVESGQRVKRKDLPRVIREFREANDE